MIVEQPSFGCPLPASFKDSIIPPTTLFFSTSRVAGNTIRKIANTFFFVFVGDFTSIMTAITGVAGQTARMAGLAGVASLAMIERESVRSVEGRRPPGAGGVAGRTVGAEQPAVISRLIMAGRTL